MLRVFIASGDAGFCATLRSFFQPENGFIVCGEARDKFETFDMVKELVPDLVVLELTEIVDLKIVQAIKAVLPEVPVFVITVQNFFSAEKEALSHGVDAVFEKEDFSSLVTNARAVCGLE